MPKKLAREDELIARRAALDSEIASYAAIRSERSRLVESLQSEIDEFGPRAFGDLADAESGRSYRLACDAQDEARRDASEAERWIGQRRIERDAVVAELHELEDAAIARQVHGELLALRADVAAGVEAARVLCAARERAAARHSEIVRLNSTRNGRGRGAAVRWDVEVRRLSEVVAHAAGLHDRRYGLVLDYGRARRGSSRSAAAPVVESEFVEV